MVDSLLPVDDFVAPGPLNAAQALNDDLSGVLQSMDELSDYLERVVHAVRRHVDGCDEVGVTILENDRPHTAAYTTVQTLQIDAVQYAINQGPCLDSARNRRENRVSDVRVKDDRWPVFVEHVDDTGVRSLMAVPLVSNDSCVGALNCYAWQPGAFDDFDASLVRVAASRAADAVVAVSAIDGLSRLAGQLEQAMASRAVIEQAKGIIMAMRGIREHDAFEVLRKTSQDRNVKLRDLAHQVVTGVTENGSSPHR